MMQAFAGVEKCLSTEYTIRRLSGFLKAPRQNAFRLDVKRNRLDQVALILYNIAPHHRNTAFASVARKSFRVRSTFFVCIRHDQYPLLSRLISVSPSQLVQAAPTVAIMQTVHANCRFSARAPSFSLRHECKVSSLPFIAFYVLGSAFAWVRYAFLSMHFYLKESAFAHVGCAFCSHARQEEIRKC